jgi:methionyl-tRNA formyltransferase
MKYIFFGTPRFAEIVLDHLLLANMPPAALVCNPDRPVGRKQILTAPPTKTLLRNGSPSTEILQPEKIDDAFIKRLRSIEPDFFIVAAYGKILSEAVLQVPKLGAFGVHPSLLPKYRGASPIQSAILAGEAETGATIYLMDEKTDHGPIVAVGKEHLTKQTNYLHLEEDLARLGAELAVKAIPHLLAGTIKLLAQNELHATYTKKFTTQDGFVEEKDLVKAEAGDAERTHIILRKINALNPEPGAWTMRGGKRIKLLQAMTEGNRLILTETQQEGERPKTLDRGL